MFPEWVSIANFTIWPKIMNDLFFLESWELTRKFLGNDLYFFSKGEVDLSQSFSLETFSWLTLRVTR